MKKIKIILNIVFLFIYDISYAQINQLNHEKYWFYRKRLVNEFLVSGEDRTDLQKDKLEKPSSGQDNRKYLAGCGLSIPARDIVDRDGGKKQLNFAESPVSLGYYIGVLATELRLLYDYGQPYENTKRELYYALKAVERIDLAAEILIEGNGGELDGFLLRDDVDYNLYDNFKYLLDSSNQDYLSSHMLSAYHSGEYENKGNSVECSEDCNNAFLTQDQIAGLFIGFSLAKTCLQGLPQSVTEHNGYNLEESVFNNTMRITTGLANDSWKVKFDNGELCKHGNAMREEFNAFAVAMAADYITDYTHGFRLSFPYEKPPNAWLIYPCIFAITNPISFLNCLLYLNITYNNWHDGQQAGWKTKGLYSSDVTNVIVPGTGKAIGRYMFDVIMFEEKHDFSGNLVFDYAAISNAWLKYNDDNITSDALKFYGMRYNTEMHAMLNSYLHGGLTYDASFKSKIKDYINSAPCNGPHRLSDEHGEGIPGWLAALKWCKPIRAYDLDEDFPEGRQMSGMDYMILYNLMWLEKSHMNDLFSISTYTYPEYYIYPTKCLNKAYYPLNIKTYEPLTLPDAYSSELHLNSSTPYQNGTYRFEAPEIELGANFSIDGPAEFVISNDTEYDLCTEQSKFHDFWFHRAFGCPSYLHSNDEIFCFAGAGPFIYTDESYFDLEITYKWRFKDSNQNIIAEIETTGKSFIGWEDYYNYTVKYVECESYYNGVSIKKITEEFEYNPFDKCCRILKSANDESISLKDISVHPNPFKEFLNVIVSDKSSRVEIFNSQGTKIYNQSNVDNSFQINTSEFPPGIYFVKVISESQIKHFKVIRK